MKLLSGLLVSSAVLSSAHAAVSLPYSNGFSTDDGQFTESTDAQWIESGGFYQNSITNSNPSAATVSVTRGATENFVMQSRFNVTTMTPSVSFGFAALGTGAATTGANAAVNFYLADVGSGGTIRILRFDGTNNVSVVDDTAATGGILGALNTTETYDLTLTGTYTGSSLVLSFTVSDGTNTRTVTSAPIASPLAGTNFGYRNRNNNTGEYVVNSDFFTMSVPEPSSVLLLGAAAGFGLLRRRR